MSSSVTHVLATELVYHPTASPFLQALVTAKQNDKWAPSDGLYYCIRMRLVCHLDLQAVFIRPHSLSRPCRVPVCYFDSSASGTFICWEAILPVKFCFECSELAEKLIPLLLVSDGPTAPPRIEDVDTDEINTMIQDRTASRVVEVCSCSLVSRHLLRAIAVKPHHASLMQSWVPPKPPGSALLRIRQNETLLSWVYACANLCVWYNRIALCGLPCAAWIKSILQLHFERLILSGGLIAEIEGVA